jgi:hypothetical protein
LAEPAKKGKSSKTKTPLQRDTSAQAVDETTFPFLELLGEIRNMIYHYILVDTEYSVRFRADVSKRDGCSIPSRLYRVRPGPPDRDDLSGQTKGSISKASHSYKLFSDLRQSGLSVNVLQVNRQIHAEAVFNFYSKNLFVFEGVPDMCAFLMHFQHRLPMMRRLGLASLHSNRKTYQGAAHLKKMPLESIFPYLAQAVNLEALYLHTPIWQSLGGRRPHNAARWIFQLGHCWMQAPALVEKKGKLAVLDTIRLPKALRRSDQYGKWQVEVAG